MFMFGSVRFGSQDLFAEPRTELQFGSACDCELRTEPGSAFERPNAPEIAE